MYCTPQSPSVLLVTSVVESFSPFRRERIMWAIYCIEVEVYWWILRAILRRIYPQIAQIPLIWDGFRHGPSHAICEICVGNVVLDALPTVLQLWCRGDIVRTSGCKLRTHWWRNGRRSKILLG